MVKADIFNIKPISSYRNNWVLGSEQNHRKQGQSKQQRGGDFFDHQKLSGMYFLWKKITGGRVFFGKI